MMQKFLNKLKMYRFYVIALFLSILLELFLSNDISTLLNPQKQNTLNLNTVTTLENAVPNNSQVHFYENLDAFELVISSGVESQNLYLEFSGSSETAVTGRIYTRDESRTADYELLSEFITNPGGTQNSVLLPLHSRGNITALKLELIDGVTEEVTLTEAVLNYDTGICFNLFRWLIMVFILLCLFVIRRYHLASRVFDEKNSRHLLAVVAVTLFNLIIIFFIGQVSYNSFSTDIDYPLDDNTLSGHSIMVKQFDAFQKGQLNLDMPLQEGLETLENPYDFTQRYTNGYHTGYAWDHVYKDGKYYSYFGVAPVLTIYYPYYALTGSLPSDARTGFILAFGLILLCSLLILQLIRFFRLKPSVLAVLMSILALPAVSYAFLLQSSADFYYTAFLSAFTYGTLFLYSSLKAYEKKFFRSGIVWYTVAGIALVLTISSRPTTAVPFITLTAPLYLHVLFDKKQTCVQKTKLVTGFCVPVALGGIAIMWYNAARFGSPFDFGVMSQLTVADIHYNKLSVSASKIKAYLEQYWLLPFTWSERFPYINFTRISCYNMGEYIYQNTCLSILGMPINFMLLGIPVFIKEKPFYKKAMVLAGLAGGTVILYSNFCLGGIHMRYTCDASFVLALLSIVITLFLLEFFHNKQLYYGKKMILLLLTVSIIMGYLLIFSNECNNIYDENIDNFLRIKKIFDIM